MTDGETRVLEEARTAYAGRDWARAQERYDAARTQAELAPDDLAALANAAWWLGRTDYCLDLSEQVYRQYLHGARVPAAAELALTLGILSLLRGQATVGSGWISRARRLLDDAPISRAHGILLSIDAAGAIEVGDFATGLAAARQVQRIGQLLGDPDSTAIGLVTEGVALVRQGQVADGMAVVDEAMLPVRAGEVTPDWTGNLYCQVMQLCDELADVPRARAWTRITERWCAGFPSAVMFSGICRMHRVQLHHLSGEWARAEREATRVCAELATMNVAVVGEAHYQLGDCRRLRGDLAGAEDSYRSAHQHGRDPQPGLALLRLASEGPASAAASIQVAVAAAGNELARARLRAAQVEIARGAGDPGTATAAAADLDRIADRYRTPGLLAAAAQARGGALLTAGDPAQAVAALRDSCRRWHELDAPYLSGRCRTLLAEALAALGDRDAAGLELTAAAAIFERLGAVVDLRAVVERQAAAGWHSAGLRGAERYPDGLTGREVEVLRRIAAGDTNREIAKRLSISEKTVARHLSNIFTKIDVSSRTSAAGYAFRHHLTADG